MTGLASVVTAWCAHEPATPWLEARQRIAEEHGAVLDALAHGLTAYGFSTRLGHEDDRALGDEDQQSLLKAHLIGPVWGRRAGWERLLACVKAQQLSYGGSGVSSNTYAAILEICRSADRPTVGNWQGSYSSGDVVPAAWWAQGLFEARPELLGESGTLITAINGNFVSTSDAISVLADLVLESARLLDVYSHHVSHLGPSGRVSALWSDGDSLPGAGPRTQPPVSLRDPTPVVAAVTSMIDTVAAAIDLRLGGPSANPLFTFDEDDVHALSNSSFLDFTLTQGLGAGLQVVSLLGGVWQRLIHHQHDPSNSLQPPKVAQAYLEQIRSLSLPTHFSGNDSQGIEDLRDQSLNAAQTLARALRLLRAVRYVAEVHVPALHPCGDADRLAVALWRCHVMHDEATNSAEELAALSELSKAEA